MEKQDDKKCASLYYVCVEEKHDWTKQEGGADCADNARKRIGTLCIYARIKVIVVNGNRI